VLANKASAAATAAKASFETSCQTCQKTYYSENAYTNHVNSQKHKNNVARFARGGRADDTASVNGSIMSSAFSLGEPMADGIDSQAEKEFSEVVDGIKQTHLDDKSEPVSRRPTRPHHSAAEDKPEHPLSRTETKSSAAEDEETSAATKTKANPLLDCLFCNYRSPTSQLSVLHMGRFHGMFIPEKEFLVDPEGLVKYLHRKIHRYHQCLKCNKIVHTTTGIQTHMRDRGHCMIAFETDAELVEVGQFYDFRSTYSDADDFEDVEREAEEEDETAANGGGVKLGAPRKVVTTNEDEDEDMSGDEEDQGWETDSTVSSVPTDEITAVPIDRTHRHKLLGQSRHHSHKDPRPHRSADGFHSHAHPTPVAVYHDEYELHLPSGRTAGHRSLNKYYRQNLRNYPGVAERMEQQRMIREAGSDDDGDVEMDRDKDTRGRRGQLTSRANGGTGMIGVTDQKKLEIRAVEKREQKNERRIQRKYQSKVEKGGNMQKHFRVSILWITFMFEANKSCRTLFFSDRLRCCSLFSHSLTTHYGMVTSMVWLALAS
jgi:pre-60S factor REI1